MNTQSRFHHDRTGVLFEIRVYETAFSPKRLLNRGVPWGHWQPPRPPATRDPRPPSPYRRTSSTRPTKSRQAHNFERAPGDLPQALHVLPRSLREQDRHARQPRPACPDEDIPVLLKSCPASLPVARLWSNERDCSLYSFDMLENAVPSRWNRVLIRNQGLLKSLVLKSGSFGGLRLEPSQAPHSLSHTHRAGAGRQHGGLRDRH